MCSYIFLLHCFYILLTFCAHESGDISYEHHPQQYFDFDTLNFTLFECYVCHIARERAVPSEFSSLQTHFIYLSFMYIFFFFFSYLRAHNFCRRWHITSRQWRVFRLNTHNFHAQTNLRFMLYTREHTKFSFCTPKIDRLCNAK